MSDAPVATIRCLVCNRPLGACRDGQLWGPVVGLLVHPSVARESWYKQRKHAALFRVERGYTQDIIDYAGEIRVRAERKALAEAKVSRQTAQRWQEMALTNSAPALGARLRTAR